MAGGSLLLLLDDIAAIMDDVAVMTKTAAGKTAGVLGDDLALNAQQVAGVVSKRELPVVFAVAKGSMINKLILVPAALLISAFIPWLVTPLLMIGGLYLCFEGAEKLIHLYHKRGKKSPEEAKAKLVELAAGSVEETAKIKGAIRTDFILSAEIIAITLGIVKEAPFIEQVLVLSIVAVSITLIVYGLVALIVKLDDMGLWLSQKKSAVAQTLGKGILWAAPFLMKALSFFGTAAMFLVGGEILTHGIGPVHHFIEDLAHGVGGFLEKIAPMVLNGLFGLCAGFLAVLIFTLIQKARGKEVAH